MVKRGTNLLLLTVFLVCSTLDCINIVILCHSYLCLRDLHCISRDNRWKWAFLRYLVRCIYATLPLFKINNKGKDGKRWVTRTGTDSAAHHVNVTFTLTLWIRLWPLVRVSSRIIVKLELEARLSWLDTSTASLAAPWNNNHYPHHHAL